jgi:hypothetical protein
MDCRLSSSFAPDFTAFAPLSFRHLLCLLLRQSPSSVQYIGHRSHLSLKGHPRCLQCGPRSQLSITHPRTGRRRRRPQMGGGVVYGRPKVSECFGDEVSTSFVRQGGENDEDDPYTCSDPMPILLPPLRL